MFPIILPDPLSSQVWPSSPARVASASRLRPPKAVPVVDAVTRGYWVVFTFEMYDSSALEHYIAGSEVCTLNTCWRLTYSRASLVRVGVVLHRIIQPCSYTW